MSVRDFMIGDTMYHVRQGWFFEQVSGGGVKVTVASGDSPNSNVLKETIFSPEEWENIVTRMFDAKRATRFARDLTGTPAPEVQKFYFTSTDGGKTWTPSEAPPVQPGGNFVLNLTQRQTAPSPAGAEAAPSTEQPPPAVESTDTATGGTSEAKEGRPVFADSVSADEQADEPPAVAGKIEPEPETPRPAA